MKSTSLARAVGILASLAIAGTVLSAGPALAEDNWTASAFAATPTTSCSPSGVTSADTALAARVHSQVGWVSAYNASCLRAIVGQAKARGLGVRGAQIAVTTAITESHLNNYSQAVDHDSLGLFQQRPSMGWGSPAQLVDPIYATNAFLNEMLRLHPNGSWGGGDIANICQKVQKSAYSDGSNYRANVGQAVALVDAAWSGAGAEHDFTGDGRADITALDPGDNLISFTGDGAGHVGWGGGMWPGHGEWAGYRAITAGDFTSDGKADVAALDPGNNLILFTGDGAGHVGWGGGMWPGHGEWAGYKAITAGDFNGDGRTDIAALDPGDNLILFTGDGAGHVGWGGGMWPGHGEWAGYKAITAGDFNGDGRTDIAALDPGSNLILFTGDGAGHVGWGGGMWPGQGEWAGYKAIV
jgi:hypothetical protein